MKLYRFEDVAYAPMADPETGEARGSGTIAVHLHEFDVVRKTPKGAWIAPTYEHVDPEGNFAYFKAGGVLRFVLDHCRKRFACATIEEARASFIARKQKQIRIYKARIARAEDALRALERLAA